VGSVSSALVGLENTPPNLKLTRLVTRFSSIYGRAALRLARDARDEKSTQTDCRAADIRARPVGLPGRLDGQDGAHATACQNHATSTRRQKTRKRRHRITGLSTSIHCRFSDHFAHLLITSQIYTFCGVFKTSSPGSGRRSIEHAGSRNDGQVHASELGGRARGADSITVT
jgi:hypothetical protein